MKEGVVREPVEMEAPDAALRPRDGSMAREVGQSFYLMALMAAMLTVYVGLGLLAVRLFG